MKIDKEPGLFFKLAALFAKHFGHFLLGLVFVCVLPEILGIPITNLITPWMCEQVARLALFVATLFALAVMVDSSHL